MNFSSTALLALVATVLTASDLAPSPGEIALPTAWRIQPAVDPATAPDPTAWSESRGGAWNRHVQGRGTPWAGRAAEAVHDIWLQQRIAIPTAWAGRLVVADFARIEGDAVIFVQGRRVQEVLRPGGLVVLGAAEDLAPACDLRLFVTRAYTGISRGLDRDPLRRWARVDNPSPLPMADWGLGVTGPVTLRAWSRPAQVSDVAVTTSWRGKRLTAAVEVTSERALADGRLRLRVLDADAREVLSLEETTGPLPAGATTRTLTAAWPDPIPWELDRGYLYRAETELVDADGRTIARHAQPFGFRELWTEGRQLILNGHPVRLRQNVLGLGLTAASLDLHRAMGCNAAYLQNNRTAWWRGRGWPETPVLDETLLAACDRAGFALYVPAPSIAFLRERLLENAELRQAYEREMAAWQRRFRNHPAILAWTVGMNALNPKDAIAPAGWGRRAPARSGMAAVIEAACGISRRLDPSRLAYSHADGNHGDLASANVYLNLAPLQERCEWPSAWAASGDMPYHAAEFGPPYAANWWKGKRFLLSEYLAIYLGERSYELEDEEALRDCERLSLAPTSAHGAWDAVDTRRYPAYWEFMALFTRRTDQAWRTFGVNGGVTYWEFDYGDPPGWAALRATSPGIPSYRRYGTLTASSLARPEWANPLFDIRLASNRPLLAWIAGAPRHTDRTHLYRTGETVAKQAALVWDGPGPAQLDLEWTARTEDGLRLDGGRLEARLEAGDIRLLPIALHAPVVAGRTACRIELRGRADGVDIPADRFPFTVFPAEVPLPALGMPVALADPLGRSAAWLARLGVATRPAAADGPRPGELLIVGREALRPGRPLPWTAASIARGGRVLVLEQRPEVWRGLGFQLTTAMPRQAFPLPGSPLLAGLVAEDLAEWRGSPDLLPAGVDLPAEVPHAPKWSNAHAIAACALRIPRAAGFRAHLACEFDLDYTPVLEFRSGAGALWCSTLDLSDRVGEDPAATRLAGNLLAAATAPLPVLRPVALLGDDADAARLARLGLRPARRTADPGDLLVAGAGDAGAARQAIDHHLAAGGTALVWPGGAERLATFGLAAEACTLVRAEPSPGHALAAGIGRAWLRWRRPLAATCLADATRQPAGTAVLLGGLLGVRGRLALLQVDDAPLRAVTGEAAASLDTSIAHLDQVQARVLTNLDAEPDPALLGRLSVCLAPPAFAPVPHWQVLGPYPAAGDDGAAMLAAGANGEASARAGDTNPNATFERGDGVLLDWRRTLRADPQGRVDLGAALGMRSQAVAYLVANVHSTSARTATLRLGADWRLRVWVNGTEVLTTLHGGNRPAAHRVAIPLREGGNVIACKVAAGSGGFALFAELEGEGGGQETPADLAAISWYAGRSEAEQFDPYEFHYW